jgi:nematocidal protein AidA
MSSIIDIDIAFDTETIVSKYPHPSQNSQAPTGIQHADAYMIAQSTDVISGQATADLNVSASVGDVIRWRASSLSGNSDQSAVVYNIVRFSGQQVTGPIQPITASPTVPVPNAANPVHYTPTPQFDYYINANVIANGKEGYQVWFYLVERTHSTLKTLGYYYWDPTLTVS